MRIFIIGITLFALYFGAGNLIFPVMLGQLSGNHFTHASLGFVITGVVLPLLGVIAVGFSGEKDCLKITQRAGKIFGLIFATTLYLTIGPLFAMPRTGSVSFEIGIKPFIAQNDTDFALIIFSIIFYGICCLLSLSPHKFIDIVGKYLTPIKIGFISILIFTALLFPMGEILPPVHANYQQLPFFSGFEQGYLTMDTLASLVFGIIVVQGITQSGVQNKRTILFGCLKATLIAGIMLAFFYMSLAYMGATSVTKLGVLDNGGQVLAHTAIYYFGTWGNLLLGLMVTVACMTTNIGLTHACANYLVSIYPKLSYRQYAILFTIISALFANIGLNELISFSQPVLAIIYPVTIVFIVLTLIHPLFKGYQMVYIGTIYCTLFTSILSQLNTILVSHNELSNDIPTIAKIIKICNNIFVDYIPLYAQGIGWITPAMIGAILGYIIAKGFTKRNVIAIKEHQLCQINNRN